MLRRACSAVMGRRGGGAVMRVAAAASQRLASVSGSSSGGGGDERYRLIEVETTNGVTTVTMNRPKKYNAWTKAMMDEIFTAFDAAAASDDTKVVVLTGNGPFYCAGVDLSAILQPMKPATLHKIIVETNQHLFDVFLDFPKPMIAAVNGPAIGASVTSASLCDAVVASDAATFHTPFKALGIVPEGCSSVHFEAVMGPDNARRMLEDGWKPTAAEALKAGLVHQVVAAAAPTVDEGAKGDDGRHPALRAAAQALGEEWIEQGFQRRTTTGERNLALLKATNATESRALADAFFGVPFLQAQRDFAQSRGKGKVALFFSALMLTRPLWALGL